MNQSHGYETLDQQVASGGAMITSPHALASEAGARVLRRGGNAIEAVIATSAVLCVVYPHFCGLGGDAVWLIADASGRVDCLSAIGQAARDLPAIDLIPARGPRSALTTACLVDSWGAALEHSASLWGGRERLASLVEDAVGLAADGFEVSASQSHWVRFRETELRAWPGFSDLFVSEGRQCQPALAATFRAIAENGPREFYEGALAREIVKGLRAGGSPLALSDFAQARTRRATPAQIGYRGDRLYAPPPPTQGITTLAIMGILEHFAMDAMKPDSPEFYHHCVEAVKRAFLDKRLIADPDFYELDEAGLLGAGHLAKHARMIDPQSALAWPDVFNEADTVFIAATDARGQSVSMLQSIYYDWGSGMIVGDTGVIWHNRGAAFNTKRNHPNSLQPGKRPFYTLNPGIAMRDGKPSLLYGTQGADGQPQTLALLLSLMIDHRLDPLAALNWPRFLLGRTFSDSRDSLKIERSAGEATLKGLQRRGHAISLIDTLSPLAGQAGLIKIGDNGLLTGAHDPRSDGRAIKVL